MKRYKRLGKCQYSTGNRLYEVHTINKKQIYKLISWIQNKCIDCGKFLKKHNVCNRCNKCLIKYLKEHYDNKSDKQWYKNNRKYKIEISKLRYFIYNHINELQVGDYI